MDIKLSIIVAVFSETSSIDETLERLLKKDRGYIHEIILLVSPYSSKECLNICHQASLRYAVVKTHIQENNPGQGKAFREGIAIARGTHVAIMSADLETEPEAIDRMVDKVLGTNCDMVVASRWAKGGGFQGYGLFKTMVNFCFQRFFGMLFRTKISDLTYGLKLFKVEWLRRIPWECDRHDFCLECSLKPIKLGAHVEEVPTYWIKRKEGRSKNSSPVNTLIDYLFVGMRIYLYFPSRMAQASSQ